MKVAIVYDRVNKWGGAERVLLALHEMFPEAPLYTSVYNSKTAKWASVFVKVNTSFLQKIPFAKDNHEKLSFLMPLAFESFDFGQFDLVISVTSEFAKSIVTRPSTRHICYCLTPTRYLWSGYEEYFRSNLLKIASRPMVKYLRFFDKIASNRPDEIVAISSDVSDRVARYYGRNSKIVFPPVENSAQFNGSEKPEPGNYFLIVSRLVSYKKIDIAIKTFNKNNLRLVVVGKGSEENRLKKMANKNIYFAGHVSERKLWSYYKNCSALVFPQKEDFGLVAVEANSCGKPVIAYRAGGAIDIIKDGVNGIFFTKQDVRSLDKAIKQFFTTKWNNAIIVSTAHRFSKQRFKKELLRVIHKHGSSNNMRRLRHQAVAHKPGGKAKAPSPII